MELENRGEIVGKYKAKVIQLEEVDKEAIEAAAEEAGMSSNQLIRNIIKKWIKNNVKRGN